MAAAAAAAAAAPLVRKRRGMNHIVVGFCFLLFLFLVCTTTYMRL